MLAITVLIVWFLLLAGLVYHYRKTPVCRGFVDLWRSAYAAEDRLDPKEDDDDGPYALGVKVGFISVFIVVIMVALLFLATLIAAIF